MSFDLAINVPLPLVGTLKTRDCSSPFTGCWTLGCETLDRGFADFNAYKSYIPALAVGTLRFQAGWAKTEQAAGSYDFSWLDALVDGAREMGLNVLLEADYGNPIYPGGAGIDIGGGIPFGEGRAAYLRWVKAMVEHFRGRVRDYAMWNEPDTARQSHTDEEIVALNMETAQAIREVLPEARLAALSVADFSNTRRFEAYIKLFAEKGVLDWFDWFIFHAYKDNPDFIGDTYSKLLGILDKYHARGKLRQGESGCPSEKTLRFAMRGYDWTELSQVKWNLRHFMTDHAWGIESSIFTICDFYHKQTIVNGPGGEINRKGLLMADEEHRVLRPKQSYYAMQCMTTLLDAETIPVQGASAIISPRQSVCYSWKRRDNGAKLLAYWDRSNVPSNSQETFPAQLMTYDFQFREPVLIDVCTGRVFLLPLGTVEQFGTVQWLRNMPVSDSPFIITERNTVIIDN